MNIKRIISSVGIGAGAIIIGLGVQYAMANWIPAPGSPPNCSDPTIPGCNAPINVGTSAQAKNGSLSLGTSVATTSVSLDVEGKLSWLTGLIDNGPFQLIDVGALAGQDNGKVLTSDANGNASWQAGGGSGGTLTVKVFNLSSGVSYSNKDLGQWSFCDTGGTQTTGGSYVQIIYNSQGHWILSGLNTNGTVSDSVACFTYPGGANVSTTTLSS